MTDDELYVYLGRLIEAMPDLQNYRENQSEIERWLAKTFAVVEAHGSVLDIVDFRQAWSHLQTKYGQALVTAAESLNSIVLRTFAKLELKVAPALQGSFIPVGHALDAYKVVGSILTAAKQRILVVDPYMDDKIVTEFMLTTPEKVQIHLLADESSFKAELKVAADKWVQQYGVSRPLAAKIAPKRTLHDRVILIDDVAAWTVTQSFKDLAKRSPASIVQSDKETAALKVAAYSKMWDEAKPL